MPNQFIPPPGTTEKDVLDAIEKAVTILAPSFVFGYWDLDDIKQQARMFCLQALERWDKVRPLENFLYTHCRNRLANLRRDKLRRNDPPCESCHAGTFCGQTEGGACRRYADWLKRNNAKANLARPLDIDNVSDNKKSHDCTTERDVEMDELLELIDEKLPMELRSYYLQMRDGLQVPKAKRQAVMDAVKEIIS